MWGWFRIETHGYEFILYTSPVYDYDWVTTIALLVLLTLAMIWHTSYFNDDNLHTVHTEKLKLSTNTHNTHTHTHTHTHTPSGIVAGDVLRYFNFSTAASFNWLICSGALATSFHVVVMVVSSQYCNMYILQCSTTPSCSMLILSNACTGTFKYAPSIRQSVTSWSSSNSISPLLVVECLHKADYQNNSYRIHWCYVWSIYIYIYICWNKIFNI